MGEQEEARKKAEKALEKVRSLLALAASTHSKEEARTSAQLAATLINKHHMVVSLDAPAPQQVVASGPIPAWWESFFDQDPFAAQPPRKPPPPPPPQQPRRRRRKHRQQAEKRQRAEKPASQPQARKPPPPPPPQEPRKGHKIRAKYPGRCGQCGDRFDAGDTVIWFPGKCCIHEKCEDHPARRPAPSPYSFDEL